MSERVIIATNWMPESCRAEVRARFDALGKLYGSTPVELWNGAALVVEGRGGYPCEVAIEVEDAFRDCDLAGLIVTVLEESSVIVAYGNPTPGPRLMSSIMAG
jgi:hypothetical protein